MARRVFLMDEPQGLRRLFKPAGKAIGQRPLHRATQGVCRKGVFIRFNTAVSNAALNACPLRRLVGEGIEQSLRHRQRSAALPRRRVVDLPRHAQHLE